MRVALCCSLLEGVAVCWGVLQYVAMCGVLQCINPHRADIPAKKKRRQKECVFFVRVRVSVNIHEFPERLLHIDRQMHVSV